MPIRRAAIFAVLAVLAAIALCNTGPARAQSSDVALAQQLTNPLANLISFPMQTNYDQGYGTGDGYRVATNFQPVIPIELNEHWNLISRTIIPVVWDQNDISPLGPSGHQTGFSDTLQSLFLSPAIPTQTSAGNLVWGVGPAIAIPTGNADPLLGSGKWGLGPTAVALVLNGPWTLGLLTNHVWDVAGKANRADVSSTFMQPFLSYTTPNAVTFSLTSESTYNWITDEWSVPINALVAKVTTIGAQKVRIQGGLRYWAASSTGGPDDLGGRLEITLLFPKK